MKKTSCKFLVSISALFCFLLLSFAHPATADIFYWNNNGLSAPTSGTWDTNVAQWSTTTALTDTPVLWNPTNAAGFPAGTSGIQFLTITVDDAIDMSGVFNGFAGPQNSVSNLVFTGSGSLNLLDGTQAVYTAAGTNNTIFRVPVTGPGKMQHQGNVGAGGSLYLSTNNTFSGGFSFGNNSGVNINNSGSFGTGPITMDYGSIILALPAVDSTGTAFATNVGTVNPITITNPVFTFPGSCTNIFVGLGAALGNAQVTFAGPITMRGAAGTTTTFDTRNTNWTFAGEISGAANFRKKQTATIILSGPNTFTGNVLVENGTLRVSSINRVVDGAPSSSLGAPTTPADGLISLGTTTTAGVLHYIGAGETTDRVINLAGTTGGATLQNDGTGPLVFTSDFTATGAGAKTLTLSGTNTATNTIAGTIVNSTAATSVTKSGTGTWYLTAANAYSGFTTLGTGGRLGIGNALAISTNTFVISGNGFFDNVSGGELTIANAFTLSGGSPTFVGSSDMTIEGSVLISNANRTITVSSNTLTLTSGITDSGAARAFTKAGAGTLRLLGANTYTGNTTVNAGTLLLGPSASFATANNFTVAASATLDASAIADFTVPGTNVFTASGSNTVEGVSAAVIKGGTTVNLGTRPVTLTFRPTSFAGDTGHPSLIVSQGTLSLGGNAFTVNNASGTPLGGGTYQLIQQTSGTINSSGSNSVTVTGSGLVATATASIVVTNGDVNLVVTVPQVGATISTPTILGDGSVQLNFSGTANVSYIIEGATNLNEPITWIPLSTNTADGGGLFNFIDTDATNFTERFYRTVNE